MDILPYESSSLERNRKKTGFKANRRILTSNKAGMLFNKKKSLWIFKSKKK